MSTALGTENNIPGFRASIDNDIDANFKTSIILHRDDSRTLESISCIVEMSDNMVAIIICPKPLRNCQRLSVWLLNSFNFDSTILYFAIEPRLMRPFSMRVFSVE